MVKPFKTNLTFTRILDKMLLPAGFCRNKYPAEFDYPANFLTLNSQYTSNDKAL